MGSRRWFKICPYLDMKNVLFLPSSIDYYQLPLPGSEKWPSLAGTSPDIFPGDGTFLARGVLLGSREGRLVIIHRKISITSGFFKSRDGQILPPPPWLSRGGAFITDKPPGSMWRRPCPLATWCASPWKKSCRRPCRSSPRKYVPTSLHGVV